MPLRWKYESVITAFLQNQLPPAGIPEITVLGRSNVGKSSLINRLVGQKVARSSGTPGKTRSINFFRLAGKHPFYLVDLPGYGYSATSQETRQGWKRLVDAYTTRSATVLHLHLVDFRHGFLKADLTSGSARTPGRPHGDRLHQGGQDFEGQVEIAPCKLLQRTRTRFRHLGGIGGRC